MATYCDKIKGIATFSFLRFLTPFCDKIRVFAPLFFFRDICGTFLVVSGHFSTFFAVSGHWFLFLVVCSSFFGVSRHFLAVFSYCLSFGREHSVTVLSTRKLPLKCCENVFIIFLVSSKLEPIPYALTSNPSSYHKIKTVNNHMAFYIVVIFFMTATISRGEQTLFFSFLISLLLHNPR